MQAMLNDEIITEVREHREEYAASLGTDLERLGVQTGFLGLAGVSSGRRVGLAMLVEG
jgi:hypothetical protein